MAKTSVVNQTWQTALTNATEALASLHSDPKLLATCSEFGDDLAETLRAGNKILICGNGGSHCDALHFAEEFTGRFRKNRRALPVLALGEAAHVTCVGNDFGFDHIFSRQVEAFAKPGDLLVVLTTSGNSANVLVALAAAKTLSTKSWALLGKDGGQAGKLADRALIVPGKTTDRIQELHMLILHIAIEHVERTLFPENY